MGIPSSNPNTRWSVAYADSETVELIALNTYKWTPPGETAACSGPATAVSGLTKSGCHVLRQNGKCVTAVTIATILRSIQKCSRRCQAHPRRDPLVGRYALCS